MSMLLYLGVSFLLFSDVLICDVKHIPCRGHQEAPRVVGRGCVWAEGTDVCHGRDRDIFQCGPIYRKGVFTFS